MCVSKEEGERRKEKGERKKCQSVYAGCTALCLQRRLPLLGGGGWPTSRVARAGVPMTSLIALASMQGAAHLHAAQLAVFRSEKSVAPHFRRKSGRREKGSQ